MDDSTAPAPPSGYQELYEPVTAVSWFELLPGEIGLLVGTLGVFDGVTVGVRDASAVFDVIWRAATLDSPEAWGVYLDTGHSPERRLGSTTWYDFQCWDRTCVCAVFVACGLYSTDRHDRKADARNWAVRAAGIGP